MDVISETTVESAWNEIAHMEESEGQKEIERIARTQPALLAFVMADCDEFSQDAQQLGLFIFVIVLKMFEKHFGSRMKTVEMEAIERLRDETEASMLALEHADEAVFEQTAVAQASAQPHVMKYITEAIFDPDPDDGVKLTEDEIGGLAMMLKTVVDALEEAGTSPSR